MAERAEVIVIGGGQAGLAAGYYLAQARIPFLILDAEARAGDAWRRRWDSLELFTAARYSALPGLAFPGDPEHFPGKDAVADYLENYARTFELPIRHRAGGLAGGSVLGLNTRCRSTWCSPSKGGCLACPCARRRPWWSTTARRSCRRT